MKTVITPSVFKAPAVLVVAIILVVETLVLSGLLGFLIYQLVVDGPDSIDSAVCLVLITFAITAWIGITAIGFVRGKSFSQGSALVWQVLQ